MKVAVLDNNGKDTGKQVELSDKVFGIEPNEHAIYLDIKHYMANQRQGTHKSKERAEIAGSTRKIKKQKGTGTARAGSIKSPVFRGGGRVFGPRPRSYGHKLNKGLKRLARKSALSLKSKSNDLVVVEDFSLENAKTKDYCKFLRSLGIDGKRSLVVLGGTNENIYLSSRNVQKSRVVVNTELHTYDLIKAKSVVVMESALEGIESNLSK